MGTWETLRLGWCKALAHTVKFHGNVETLRLGWCKALAHTVKFHGNVETLRLGWCKALAHTVKFHGNVETLRLGWCKALAHTVKFHGNVETLRLGWCKALAHMVKFHGNVETLRLGWCKALAHTVKFHGNVETLRLGWCKALAHNGEVPWERGDAATGVVQGEWRDGIMVFMGREQSTWPMRLNTTAPSPPYSYPSAPTLSSALLPSVQIGVKGAEYMADALKYNSTINTLDLRANALGDEGAAILALSRGHSGPESAVGERAALLIGPGLPCPPCMHSLRRGAAIGNALRCSSASPPPPFHQDRGHSGSESRVVNEQALLAGLGFNEIRDRGLSTLSFLPPPPPCLPTGSGHPALSLRVVNEQQLSSLDLGFNEIRDRGAYALAEALKANGMRQSRHLTSPATTSPNTASEAKDLVALSEAKGPGE
ncbi:unnamed protein product [Closterium sp. NIES-64]|nr:unnamed protein product [Closterium sp. NIES-64]